MMRVMNTILAEYLGKFVWVYLDDIVVFSDTVQQHLEHLHLIFDKLRKHKFYLKISKCGFMQDELKLLGHIIRGHQILPHPERIRKLQEWTTPHNKEELQNFL